MPYLVELGMEGSYQKDQAVPLVEMLRCQNVFPCGLLTPERPRPTPGGPGSPSH